MSSSKVLAFLAVLVVLVPSSAFGRIFDGLALDLAPFYDELCDKINCGKGSCQAKDSVIFSYECECEAGWKRGPIDQINDYLKFLPCIYPECILNFSISIPALPPLPHIPVPFNLTDFDPCYFTKCGEGTCNSTSPFEHTCECNPGYKNLFNVSSFPCYSIHSLGSNCGPLGLEVPNAEVPNAEVPKAEVDTYGANQATSFLPGKFHWMAIFIVSAAKALWKEDTN